MRGEERRGEERRGERCGVKGSRSWTELDWSGLDLRNIIRMICVILDNIDL